MMNYGKLCCYCVQILTPEQHDLAQRNNYDFDHPDAFDFELLYKTLKRLREGKKVQVPVYNFTTHKREKYVVRKPAQFVKKKLWYYIYMFI